MKIAAINRSVRGRPRIFFDFATAGLSFRRRSIEPLVGFVFLRGGGGGSAAFRIGSFNRSRASSRLS